MRKDVRQHIERAKADGWEYVGLTGRDHHKLRCTRTGAIVFCSATPSDPRALKNNLNDMKRARMQALARGK